MRISMLMIMVVLLLSGLCPPISAQKGILLDDQSEAGIQADVLMEEFFTKRTDDLPEMLLIHSIRVLVIPSRSTYFIDQKGQPRGLEYDLLKKREKSLNKSRRKGEPPVTLKFIPVALEEMIDALVEGRGDIAGLSVITPEREAKVAFTKPIYDNIKEVIVTRKGGPAIIKLEDLSGREVYVARGSAQLGNMIALNEHLQDQGLAPARVIETEPCITQENLMEMIHSGVIPACVVLEPFARLWGKVFKDLVIHDSIPVATGQKVAWAVRKENPELLAKMNAAIAVGLKKDEKLFARHFNEYFANVRWISNPFEKGSKNKLVGHFSRQAAAFGLDWIQLMAQGFQESGLNPKARSPCGAVGIMQMLPSTAKWLGVANYLQIEGNIQVGAKYMKQLLAKLAENPAVSEQDRFYFTLAAYNSGPGRIAKYRTRAPSSAMIPTGGSGMWNAWRCVRETSRQLCMCIMS